MKIYLNSEEREFQGETIADLFTQFALPQKGVALAIGDKVIPRSKYAEYSLKEGDRITLITATHGG